MNKLEIFVIEPAVLNNEAGKDLPKGGHCPPSHPACQLCSKPVPDPYKQGICTKPNPK